MKYVKQDYVPKVDGDELPVCYVRSSRNYWKGFVCGVGGKCCRKDCGFRRLHKIQVI